jgi:hypothetical protein
MSMVANCLFGARVDFVFSFFVCSKMSDSIVKALIKLKCPHALQSHQIQGLDLDKCFPVIQWLIKKVVETRLVTGDLVRS